MILAYTPDLNLETIIPHYNQRWKEKYLWALHSICYQQLTNGKEFKGYVNVNLTLLQKYLGSKYTKYILSQLLNSKIIEVQLNEKGTPIYSAGAFSKAYRINPEILENTRIKATPIKKKTYVRKITNVRTELVKEAFKLNANLQHEFLMLTYRRIKYREAYEYIKATYKPESKQFQARLVALNEFNEMHKASFLQGKELLPFHFSYNKGRVYSPASMLPRDLEQFTYFQNYENEASISLDMPNSQLCFFDELVKRSVFHKKSASNVIQATYRSQKEVGKVHNIGDYNNEIYINNMERPENTKNEVFPFLNYNSSIPSSLCYELSNENNSWKSFIRKGLGYEIMMKHYVWKNKTENHTKEERQEFKAIFFGQLFYNRYIPKYLTPLEEVFMKHFEEEATNLRQIKRQLDGVASKQHNEKLKQKKKLGNSLLAVQVQTLEGKFFHDICVNYIKTNYKSVPFTIKHDSITLPQSEAAYLVDELNQLVQKFFNDNQMKFKVETL